MEAAGAVSTVSMAEPEQAAPVAPPVAQPAEPDRPQARLRGDRPTAYNYVGMELRRIGVLATVAVAALVALSFVL